MSTKHKETIFGILYTLYACSAVPFAVLPAAVVRHLTGGYWIPMMTAIVFLLAWLTTLYFVSEWPKKHGNET